MHSSRPPDLCCLFCVSRIFRDVRTRSPASLATLRMMIREYRQSSPRGIGRDYEPTVRPLPSSGRVFSEFTGSPSLHAVADFHRGLYFLLLPFQSIRLILILQDAVPVNMPAPPPARAAQAAPHVCSQGHQPPGAVGVLCMAFHLLTCPRCRWQNLCSRSHLLLASIPQVPTHVRRLWLHFTSVTGSVSQKKD